MSKKSVTPFIFERMSNRQREQRSIEEIILNRRVLSESAPMKLDARKIRPETSDKLFDSIRRKTIALGQKKNRAKSSGEVLLPAIKKSSSVATVNNTVQKDSYANDDETVELFDTVVDYCRTLQLKVKVCLICSNSICV